MLSAGVGPVLSEAGSGSRVEHTDGELDERRLIPLAQCEGEEEVTVVKVHSCGLWVTTTRQVTNK